MGNNHIAQMNFGRLLHDWDDPRVAEFVDNVDFVNGVAARAKGFVWRLSDEDMDAAQNDHDGIFGGDARIASTLSVWETAADLVHFVHNTLHAGFMAKRDQWQEKLPAPTYVIWPIPTGHRPTMQEAKKRLDMLADSGASAAAFDFKYMDAMSISAA